MTKTVKVVLKVRLSLATLYLLALTILMHVSHAADDLCDGQGSALKKEEVAVVCPVREDIHNTKHSVIIRHFDGTDSHPMEVFACDWLSRLNRFDCLAKFGFELVAIKKDHVVAKVPRDKLLTTGSYRCQLAPAKIDEVHAYCSICYPAVADEPTDLAKLGSKSPDAEEKLYECPACHAEANCHEKLNIVYILCIVITLLLCVITVFLAAILFKRKRQWTSNKADSSCQGLLETKRHVLRVRPDAGMTVPMAAEGTDEV